MMGHDSTLLNALEELAPAYVTLRRDLHAHPELAFAERRTSDRVAEVLARLGLEVHRGLAKTGVVGVLRVGQGKGMIGLRADMDALPLSEKNTFPHASTHPGQMHACGHDGHTAMLLAAADHLSQTRLFDGTVCFIFQPAEEAEGGGRVMVEQGLFDRFPVDAVYGLHNWPGLPAGQFAVHPGAVMAATDRIDIRITGRGTHAAMPHLGDDCILAGATLVQSLQTLISREVDPLESAVLSVTRFHAGEAYNILPDEAQMSGTLRSFDGALRSRLLERIKAHCRGVAQTLGVEITLTLESGYPATRNTREEALQCRRAARTLVGDDQVLWDPPPSMGAEDFAYFLERKPGCYAWIGNGPGNGGCVLHNPHYDFNDAILPLGAAYWVTLTEQLLAT